MCGIVGYAGNVKTACGKPLEVCLQGLQRLEYRGYDSAGVALTAPDMGHVEVRKKAGRLANLVEDVERNPMPRMPNFGRYRNPIRVNGTNRINAWNATPIVHVPAVSKILSEDQKPTGCSEARPNSAMNAPKPMQLMTFAPTEVLGRQNLPDHRIKAIEENLRHAP